MRRYCDACAPTSRWLWYETWHACLNSLCDCTYSEYHYELLPTDPWGLQAGKYIRENST